ncbi:unnamed protein product [Lymnaea stagnalis]|uniref:Amine oxidase domain-containing protein n=1 Tax=Lymnaea stagnalis TaxID=6523 RepID=A0AAV2IMM6_LYMST
MFYFFLLQPTMSRSFQIVFACLLAVALAQRDPDDREVDKCDRKIDIAIIGAGVSGTYAAYHLRNASKTIEIFEQSDRIGGRHYTTYLEGVAVDLGAMMYSADKHFRMAELVEELELTQEEFKHAFGKPEEKLYYMREQNLNQNDIKNGNVPYSLTPEEKRNSGRFVRYVLEKLTGYKEDDFPREVRLTLKGPNDVPLYKYTIDEALDAAQISKEGKEFFKALIKLDSHLYKDANAVTVFSNDFDYDNENATMYRLKEGMESVPTRLSSKFLEASEKHNITLNRKLYSIQRIKRVPTWEYSLKMIKTKTGEEETTETGLEEIICAKKVILAVPKQQLSVIQWEPLKSELVSKAIDAVRPVPISKIAMSFSQSHWLTGANQALAKFSDEMLGNIYDLGKSNDSNRFVLLASYTEGEDVERLEALNQDEEHMVGSIEGEHCVSNELKDEVIRLLKKIYGVNFSDPTKAVSRFWNKSPFEGGVSQWRAGYHYDEVISILRHPSPIDDVYIVGGDHGWGNSQRWTEGALESVEMVLERHFSDE